MTTILKNTPWGKPQDVEFVADGIMFYSTASHGGYKVSSKLNKRIPKIFRDAAGVWVNKAPGWYEEDCAYAIVEVFLPELFPAEKVLQSINTVKRWYPEQWKAYVLQGENASL